MKKSKWMGGEYLLLARNLFDIVVEWRKRYLILKGSKLFFAKVFSRI